MKMCFAYFASEYTRATAEFGSHAGTAWKSSWCAVNHRRNDWASRSSSRRGLWTRNHDRACDRRDGWVGL